MKTDFSLKQLADPKIRIADDILRKCVHCGFCTATCPTYVLAGDELDSPRGRIYQIKDMFESGGNASPQVTKHIDRCLSCLSCMTTCPSGVHYMHLVDEARNHIQQTYKRSLIDRILRSTLAFVLPYPKRFSLALRLARLGRPFVNMFETIKPLKPVAAMLRLAPKKIAQTRKSDSAGTFVTSAKKIGRVAMLSGCANSVLEPAINQATIRVLNRAGFDVVVSPGVGCCGSLDHHMGREKSAHKKIKQNIDAWMADIASGGLDAIIINASGCGTTIKDYGHMLAQDADYCAAAKTVSELAKDISEFLASIKMAPVSNPQNMRLAYHSACSLQHGQKIKIQPKQLLVQAGFDVYEIPEGHLCCGSAGVYNIFQPQIADELKQRKLGNIKKVRPQIIAAGNIGCITQLGNDAGVPVIHTIELLDWAQGGPKPEKLG